MLVPAWGRVGVRIFLVPVPVLVLVACVPVCRAALAERIGQSARAAWAWVGAWRVSRGADSRIAHLRRFGRARSDRLAVAARVAWAEVEQGSEIVPQHCRGILAAAARARAQAQERVQGWAIAQPRCLAPLAVVAPALASAAIGRRRCRATSAVAIVPPRSPAASVAPAVLTGPVSVG